MNTNPKGIWTGKWQIVRADLDLAHVFAPQDEISFEKSPDGTGYTVLHNRQPAKYLQGATLTEVEAELPRFDIISHDYPVPEFSKHHKRRYRSLADKVEAYVQGDPKIGHLAGTIKIQCHGFAYQAQENEAVDYEHKAGEISTPIRVYQFPDVVEKNRRLLVIYKPLHPSCVTNGNGTVIGYD